MLRSLMKCFVFIAVSCPDVTVHCKVSFPMSNKLPFVATPGNCSSVAKPQQTEVYWTVSRPRKFNLQSTDIFCIIKCKTAILLRDLLPKMNAMRFLYRVT